MKLNLRGESLCGAIWKAICTWFRGDHTRPGWWDFTPIIAILVVLPGCVSPTPSNLPEPSQPPMEDAAMAAALIRHDVRWWDGAVWHPQPELAEASNAIMGLVQ